MKYLIISIVLTVSLCEVHSLLCQSFNKKTKLFEQYCESIKGIVSGNCSKLAAPIEPCKVQHLKVGACDGNIVWNAIERYYQIRSLDISNSGYKSINWLDGSSFKLKQLRKFNASHNEITMVWKLLRNTIDVIEIDLSYNQLEAIDSTAFAATKKLHRIYLSHNKLKFIANDAFKELNHLEYIDLSDNFFRDMPAFPYNTKLKAIHLERNQIVYFNCPSMALVNRAIMHMSWQSMLSFYGYGSCENSQIHVIPDAKRELLAISYIAKNEMHCNAQSFRKLYSFIAGRNSFANVTDILPYLNVFLTNLDLSGNFVGKIHQNTFERFDQLITLSLSDTVLNEFDFSWIKNQNYRLKTLDISYNNLKYAENVPHLARFFSLIQFNAAGNHLANTPDIIHYLRPTIKELDLSGCFVGLLNSTTFERFHMLQTLKLRNSSLIISRVNPFEALQNLEHLDISYNTLRNMNFSILANISRLSKLNIAHCHIVNISQMVQHLKPTIKQLDLAGNIAGPMNNQTFEMLTSLELLNLSDTNIVKFDMGILKNLTNLRIFDISHNKLRHANVERLPNSLKHLYLEGNDLMKLDSFQRLQFPWLQSLAISQNQFSCLDLRKFIADWRGLQFYENPLIQKHGKFCPCSAHGITDFLGSVYSKVKFW